MTTLLTPRLALRPWRADDLDELAAIYGDPEVMRYILDGCVRSREQTAAHMAKLSADWAERGYGLFAVEVRATGALAGWAGLAVPEFLPEVMPAVEIGWRLGRLYWGYGYATEAAQAALKFGFVDRNLDRIISIRHVDNLRSARVMDKLGLRFERRTTVPVHEQPVDVFTLTREEYLAAPQAAAATAVPERDCWLHPDVAVRPSPIEGLGLFATAPIAAATVVSRLGGRLVTGDELAALFASSESYVDTITVAPDRHLVLPPGTPNGRGNHGCDPNLWWIGPYELAARRDINAGAELTNDYATSTADPAFTMPCWCGAALCRQLVTGDDWRRPELQMRYGPHWVPALLALIAGVA